MLTGSNVWCLDVGICCMVPEPDFLCVNFQNRYLRNYFELEKIKNISPHLLVEICSFLGSFEMTETIRGYQNKFSLQKQNPEVKKCDFFNLQIFFVRKVYFDTP